MKIISNLTLNARFTPAMYLAGILFLSAIILLQGSLVGVMADGGEEEDNEMNYNYTAATPDVVIDARGLLGEADGRIALGSNGHIFLVDYEKDILYALNGNNSYLWNVSAEFTYVRGFDSSLINQRDVALLDMSNDGSLTVLIGSISGSETHYYMNAYLNNGTMLWSRDITPVIIGIDEEYYSSYPSALSVSQDGALLSVSTSDGRTILYNATDASHLYTIEEESGEEVWYSFLYDNGSSIIFGESLDPTVCGDFKVYSIAPTTNGYNLSLIMNYDSCRYYGPILKPQISIDGRFVTGIASQPIADAGTFVSAVLFDLTRNVTDDPFNPNPVCYTVDPVERGFSSPVVATYPIVSEVVFFYIGYDNGTVQRLDLASDVIPGDVPQTAWFLQSAWSSPSGIDDIGYIETFLNGDVVLAIRLGGTIDILDGATGENFATVDDAPVFDAIVFSDVQPVFSAEYIDNSMVTVAQIELSSVDGEVQVENLWSVHPNKTLTFSDDIVTLKALRDDRLALVTSHKVLLVNSSDGRVSTVWDQGEESLVTYTSESYPPEIRSPVFSSDGSYLSFILGGSGEEETSRVYLIDVNQADILWSSNIEDIISNVSGKNAVNLQYYNALLSIGNGSWIALYLDAGFTYWDSESMISRDSTFEGIIMLQGVGGDGSPGPVLPVGDQVERLITMKLGGNNTLAVVFMNGGGSDHGKVVHPFIEGRGVEGESSPSIVRLYSVSSELPTHVASANLTFPLSVDESFGAGSFQASVDMSRMVFLETNTSAGEQPFIEMYSWNGVDALDQSWGATVYNSGRGMAEISLTDDGSWLSLVKGRFLFFFNVSCRGQPLWMYENTVHEGSSKNRFRDMSITRSGEIAVLDNAGMVFYFNNTYAKGKVNENARQGNEASEPEETITAEQKEKLREFHNITPILKKRFKELDKLVKDMNRNRGNETDEIKEEYNATMEEIRQTFKELVENGLVESPPTTGMSETVKERMRALLEARYGPMLENYPSIMGRLYLIIWLYG